MYPTKKGSTASGVCQLKEDQSKALWSQYTACLVSYVHLSKNSLFQ